MNKMIKWLLAAGFMTIFSFAAVAEEQDVNAVKAECTAEAKQYNAIDPEEYIDSCVKERMEDEKDKKADN